MTGENATMAACECNLLIFIVALHSFKFIIMYLNRTLKMGAKFMSKLVPKLATGQKVDMD
jgi:hypothetical protein